MRPFIVLKGKISRRPCWAYREACLMNIVRLPPATSRPTGRRGRRTFGSLISRAFDARAPKAWAMAQDRVGLPCHGRGLGRGGTAPCFDANRWVPGLPAWVRAWCIGFCTRLLAHRVRLDVAFVMPAAEGTAAPLANYPRFAASTQRPLSSLSSPPVRGDVTETGRRHESSNDL